MIKWIVEEFKLPAPPFWLIAALLILLSLHLVPLAFIARARVSDSTKPRVHMFLDMDRQAKLKAQADSTVFADGRAMRKPVAGTVAWGDDPAAPDASALAEDDHYFRGYKLTESGETVYFEGFPEQVVVDDALLMRGQTQYNTFCFPCHGMEGVGNGPIQQRALKLSTVGGLNGWVQPTNVTDAERAGQTEGQLFNTITNGIRKMAGYGSQVPVEDRWAIVAYLRALQLRQDAPDGQ